MKPIAIMQVAPASAVAKYNFQNDTSNAFKIIRLLTKMPATDPIQAKLPAK
jgi:hypothetical protein